MSQFDVYENPSRATRNTFPYLVDVQSPYLDDLETRIVIPLVKATLTNGASMKRLTPVVTFEEEKLLVLTPQISAISKRGPRDFASKYCKNRRRPRHPWAAGGY